jgi:hypothetical protein
MRRRRFDLGQLCVVILAAFVVCSPAWSPSGGDRGNDRRDTAARVMTPGLETGILRATLSAALAGESDRTHDRRSYPSLAIALLAGLLGVLALTGDDLGAGRDRFRAGRFPISFGSRAPPQLLPT